MSLRAGGLVDAAGYVVDALEAMSVKVYAPPIPTTPVAGPCVLVQTPQRISQGRLDGSHGVYEASCLVVASDTFGSDLLGLSDEATALLEARGFTVAAAPVIYQPPSMPAALPAMLLEAT